MEKFIPDIKLGKAAIDRQPFSLGAAAVMLASLMLFLLAACGSGPASGSRVVFHPSGVAEPATLYVEVARTGQEKAKGLMNRTQLGAGNGMIFIWEDPVTESFWMKNTPLPLSIAFISVGGVIVDIQDMEPFSVQPHAPAAAYIYAVEANQGWFSAHGIAMGDRAEFFER